jgi:hypothetical protein
MVLKKATDRLAFNVPLPLSRVVTTASSARGCSHPTTSAQAAAPRSTLPVGPVSPLDALTARQLDGALAGTLLSFSEIASAPLSSPDCATLTACTIVPPPESDRLC